MKQMNITKIPLAISTMLSLVVFQPALAQAGSAGAGISFEDYCSINNLDMITEYRQGLAEAERQYGRDGNQTVNAVLNLARALHKKGQNKEAEQLYKRASAHSSFDAASALADFYSNVGRYAEAESLLRKIATDVPGGDYTLNRLAFVLGRQKKFEEAESTYNRSIATATANQTKTGAQIKLASLYIDWNKLRQAEQILQKILASKPELSNRADAEQEYARLLRLTGRQRQAQELDASAKQHRAEERVRRSRLE